MWNTEKKTSSKTYPLQSDFLPSEKDIICGRGAYCFNHTGNERFRQIIDRNLELYASTVNKYEKSVIISEIVKRFSFVKKVHGQFFEIGNFLAREKTSQAFRDAQTNKFKPNNRENSSGSIESSKSEHYFSDSAETSSSNINLKSTFENSSAHGLQQSLLELTKLSKINKFYSNEALGYQKETILTEEIFDDYFQVKAGENLNNSYASMEYLAFNNLWHDGNLKEIDNNIIDLQTNDPKEDVDVTTADWNPSSMVKVDSLCTLPSCTGQASVEPFQKVGTQLQGCDLIEELTIHDVERIVEEWKGSVELYAMDGYAHSSTLKQNILSSMCASEFFNSF